MMNIRFSYNLIRLFESLSSKSLFGSVSLKVGTRALLFSIDLR